MPEVAPCPLCDATDGDPLPRLQEYARLEAPANLRRCRSCGFDYLSPRPTREEYAELYASHPYYSAENTTRGATRHRFYEAKMERLERLRPGRGRLLGVGCIEAGYSLAAAQERGWQVDAVEWSPILANHARSQLSIPVRASVAWDLSIFEGSRFDVIYSVSLEHMLSPRETLRQCHRYLAPGGLLMIEVPNQFASLMELLKQGAFDLVGTAADRWIQREPRMIFHTAYFTPATLRAMLAKEGFEVLELRTYLPFHPLYRGPGTRRWIQEAIHAAGGLIGRGPCIEAIARPITRSATGNGTSGRSP